MHETDTNNEKHLLQLIATNDDEKAFATLVSRYWNNIYAQAITYLKNSHQAQDVVQEVFLKIWEKRSMLPDVERFDSFLFIIARNRIISELRKKLTLPLNDNLAEESTDNTTLPDKSLSFKILQEHLKAAVDLLPPQQKMAYLLSREEGLSYEAIAVKMNLSKETVKKHIGRALNFLRTYIRTHSDIAHFIVVLSLLFG